MNRLSYMFIAGYLLVANTLFASDRQDTLRGSNGRGRYWWDVSQYVLRFSFDADNKSIRGQNYITFKVTGKPCDSMQIDLQEPMQIDSILLMDPVSGPRNVQSLPRTHLRFSREGNAWWLSYPFSKLETGGTYTLWISYQGAPRAAVNPPWDGGFIWTRDSAGRPWYAVACQGLGASSWWPCKDYQGDEPDSGMYIGVEGLPRGFQFISNGHKLAQFPNPANKLTNNWWWRVVNPINSYDATFYIGDYTSWSDTLMGEKGMLDIQFFALRNNEAKARAQFEMVKPMLHCFEHWFGPYPFYEDGYKLVEAPYLGMEHQSAVAYGNQYQMGYKGKDRSKTGVGMLFDFIIVHESGHEWFGNNVTASDITENWIHEGFTTYSEALFAECMFGKEKAFTYTRGQWGNIQNDGPVMGPLGVNDHGSTDKYDKGSALIHTIRTIMGNDDKFRQLLRNINKDFYHKIVSSGELEKYICRFTGIDLRPVFEQYLRTTRIPVLEWRRDKHMLSYRFTNAVADFMLPVAVTIGQKTITIYPDSQWRDLRLDKKKGKIVFSNDLLMKTEEQL